MKHFEQPKWPVLRFGNECARCRTLRPPEELNSEAVIHHGARRPECLDRKACERRRRKRKPGQRP